MPKGKNLPIKPRTPNIAPPNKDNPLMRVVKAATANPTVVANVPKTAPRTPNIPPIIPNIP